MQKYIKEVEQHISKLPLDLPMPFLEAKVKDISTDTLRRILHRLHDKGVVTIVKRGYFKRVVPFSELLFVYGSLKKGFDNHHLLDRYSKRVGKAITVGKFGMYEDSFGNYPYLVAEPKKRVHGELYLILREELMDKIDEFEGTPDFYERKKILVKSHKGTNRAFVYIRMDATVPENQQPLKEWKDNSDYKVKLLEEYLESVVEA